MDNLRHKLTLSVEKKQRGWNDMEAQIYDFARAAGQALLNPILLTVPVIGVLGLVTGAAGRVAVIAEDFLADHTEASADRGGSVSAALQTVTPQRTNER
jgi:hypothetical protein